MAAHSRALIPLDRNPLTFADAAASYLEYGGEARYLPAIIAYFGAKPIAEITPFDVKQMALALYETASNATRNRQALTPARSVLIHAYERGWCALMRLTRFRQETPKRKTPAGPAWLQLVVRQCDRDGLPHTAAIIMFMFATGARVSEAVRLCWSEVDLVNRRVVLLRTKTSRHSERKLTNELVSRMLALSTNARPEGHVFRYTSRYSVNERIKAVCARASVSYKSPHLCGRHSFATNSLALGAPIKEAMEAGDWRSSVVFLETYVHTQDATGRIADRFNSIEFSRDL